MSVARTKQDTKIYKIEEAIKKVKAYSKEKFNSTVELHVAINTDPKKQEQNIRFSINLPNGTGKTKKVAVLASNKVPNADIELSEADIDKLASGVLRPKIDFDVIVSESKFMPKLAKAAKVLGPAGVMPNPKTGTVTDDVEKAVALIKKGKVEVKNEKDAAVIHTILGKTSFEDNALVENYNEIMTNLKQNKPSKLKETLIKNAFVKSSMGPSFAVDISDL